MSYSPRRTSEPLMDFYGRPLGMSIFMLDNVKNLTVRKCNPRGSAFRGPRRQPRVTYLPSWPPRTCCPDPSPRGIRAQGRSVPAPRPSGRIEEYRAQIVYADNPFIQISRYNIAPNLFQTRRSQSKHHRTSDVETTRNGYRAPEADWAVGDFTTSTSWAIVRTWCRLGSAGGEAWNRGRLHQNEGDSVRRRDLPAHTLRRHCRSARNPPRRSRLSTRHREFIPRRDQRRKRLCIETRWAGRCHTRSFRSATSKSVGVRPMQNRPLEARPEVNRVQRVSIAGQSVDQSVLLHCLRCHLMVRFSVRHHVLDRCR
jgi:hypothetical protein